MITKNIIKNFGFSAIAVTTLSLASCSTKNKTLTSSSEHTAKTALDYQGVYLGVLPCADCEGIKTRISLNQDNTYLLQQDYLGKSKTSISEQGTYSFDKSGNVVTLKPNVKNGQPLKFFVSENYINMLNLDGSKITTSLKDNYILTKAYNQLLNKKWNIQELYGKAFDAQNTMKKDGSLILEEAKGRYVSSAGCNQLNGGYKVEAANNKISFNQGISTMMSCPNMEAEQALAKVLQETKYFDVQGDKLYLQNDKHKTIASFKNRDSISL
ncbi:copper resistance protein NlpE N-terminal domain-containing protein [Soonwooa sp.]|uniref:copper resistance protein NlpE N-terminal domain-containing protein n=1 Tax=Soonwooa sp. TaxID=1938592 RepID=UPI00262AD262|nr:copper resistance protein NlpE N-terminal domain-containing protein [Soonwooa sp.]